MLDALATREQCLSRCAGPACLRVRMPCQEGEGDVRPGGVLDLDLTALDRQAEFIAIDKQPNDDVVHLDRFRKAHRLAHQTLDTCA